jgi:hypothetical protein
VADTQGVDLKRPCRAFMGLFEPPYSRSTLSAMSLTSARVRESGLHSSSNGPCANVVWPP